MKEPTRQSQASYSRATVKTLALLLGYLLMASVGACGDDNPTEAPATAPAAPAALAPAAAPAAPTAVPINQIVTPPVPLTHTPSPAPTVSNEDGITVHRTDPRIQLLLHETRIRGRNPYAYRRSLTAANVPMLLVYANTAG